ncbi:hypothetical protein CAPTEDRAFT_195620 [Capitella teleta]|uniref:Retrotransposon gag domain-containing protein n=1 Tax=Capitella teleta TaxID=283909 RepID=R7URG5_CAPTE|nr:hypothetical protein CAPTEDRAFT_195620 [Capitella teleta]|eukprot:ELU06507.1 hypothetical protein CAPTEDRAFT_195620 [Capitella teleta]
MEVQNQEEQRPTNGAGAAAPQQLQQHTVSGIRPPNALALEGANAAENWKIFRQKWENYAIITKVANQEMQYQVALLLHTVGDQALRIYNGFQFTTPDDQRTTKEIIEAFEKFAIGSVNVAYERFIFNKREQGEGEPFDAYLTQLRTLIKTCDYCETCVDSILRDKIIIGVRDAETQKHLLKERT